MKVLLAFWRSKENVNVNKGLATMLYNKDKSRKEIEEGSNKERDRYIKYLNTMKCEANKLVIEKVQKEIEEQYLVMQEIDIDDELIKAVEEKEENAN